MKPPRSTTPAKSAPTPSSPPAPSAAHRLALRFNTVACASVWIAILTYCFAEESEVGLAMFSTIACLIGWWLGRGRRTADGSFSASPIILPKLVVNVLVLLALANAAFNVMGGGFGNIHFGNQIVSILAKFLVYIQLIKLFDRDTPRDDGHVLGLSVFVVIGAILTSNSLTVGLLLMIYTPMVIAAAMMLQLLAGFRAARDASNRVPADLTIEPLKDEQLYVVGRNPSRDLRRAGILGFLAVMAMAITAFVLTPRGLGENILGAFGRVGAGSRIGFTDNIKLGLSGPIGNNDTPVMDVRVFDAQDQNIGAQMGFLYLRGTTNDQYNQQTHTWQRRRGLADAPPIDRRLRPGYAEPFASGRERTNVIRQDITFRRANLTDGYLFSLWRPLEITNVSRELEINDPGLDIVLKVKRDDAGRLFSYSLRSAMEFTEVKEAARPRVRFENAQIRELAQRLVAERGITGPASEWSPDVVRRAVGALQDHLRATCTYTRDQFAPNEQEDPIEMFLFRTQQGHCEYFASSLVAMCQSLGIDARIVAGYVAAQFDSSTGAFTVLESNAHAWAEVRLAPGRWQQFDPSPPDEVSREHRDTGGLMARIKRLYEAINFTWSSAVISFDRSKQSGLMGARSPEASRSLTERLSRYEIWNWLRQLSARRVLGWIALAGCVFVCVWALRRFTPNLLHKLNWPGAVKAGGLGAKGIGADPHLRKLLEQTTFYARLLRVLRQAGIEKPAFQPPLTYAGHVARTNTSAGADVERLARLYYQVRFGRVPLAANQIADAESALQRVEQALLEPRPA